MTKKQEKIETYSIRIFCTNCDYGDSIGRYLEIPQGTLANNFIDLTECPKCGCYSLTKKI